MADDTPQPSLTDFQTDAEDGMLANPQQFHAAMREETPVMRVDGVGVIITRHEDVMYALRHPEVFSSSMDAIDIGNIRPLIPLQIDPPDHVKFRRLLDPLFAPREMARLESDVRALVTELLDRIADAGNCEFNGDIAIPLPCTVFLRLMGLPL